MCYSQRPGLLYGTDLERLADCDVSVESHQQNQPDGGRLRSGSENPGVRLHVREDASQGMSKSIPVADLVDGLERLDEDAGDEVDCIDDGQSLQQPVGGVWTIAVSTKHDH